MDIQIGYLLEGARKAEGLAVIIDVLRAGATVLALLERGTEKIFPVAAIEEAFSLKGKHPDWVLVGEKDGREIKGFDCRNSPTQIADADFDFSGRTVCLRTGSGAKGILAAGKADEIILGTFPNSAAVEAYIQERGPEKVSLVSMGWNGETRAAEDDQYAEYLKQRLEGGSPDYNSFAEKIMSDDTIRGRWLSGSRDFPEGDLDYCLRLNTSKLVPRVYREGGLVVVRAAGR